MAVCAVLQEELDARGGHHVAGKGPCGRSQRPLHPPAGEGDVGRPGYEGHLQGSKRRQVMSPKGC